MTLQATQNDRADRRYSLHTEILIVAQVESVWAALVDFPSYQIWNPFIPHASGAPVNDNQLKLEIHPPGDRRQKYKVRITQLVPNQILSWRGGFKIPGLINGFHSFELRQIGEGSTLLIQREYFTGLLVPFVWNSYLNTKLRNGFYDLNRCLKTYVEGRVGKENREHSKT